jgi:hypothetical protein
MLYHHCFFNFGVEYVIRKVQEIQVRLRLNGTHQLLAYADGVNQLRDNIDTIKENTETLIDASKEVGLEMNGEKTKYMLLPRHQNAVQNHDQDNAVLYHPAARCRSDLMLSFLILQTQPRILKQHEQETRALL